MSEIHLQKLQDSENSYINTSFWSVHPLYLLVQNGDTEALREKLNIQLDHFPMAGRISRDEKKQFEYMTVSLVNTFMIAAIQGGVYPPEANWIADAALRRLSRFRNISEIPDIVRDTAFQLCEMVALTKQTDSGNPHVEKAKHYLTDHLTQEIRMEDAAEYVGLSKYHLCHLFKDITGQTMREYLTQERINAAAHLLAESSYTILQIASLFQFCDQSYFTQTFKRLTGTTPNQYRKVNTR